MFGSAGGPHQCSSSYRRAGPCANAGASAENPADRSGRIHGASSRSRLRFTSRPRTIRDTVTIRPSIGAGAIRVTVRCHRKPAGGPIQGPGSGSLPHRGRLGSSPREKAPIHAVALIAPVRLPAPPAGPVVPLILGPHAASVFHSGAVLVFVWATPRTLRLVTPRCHPPPGPFTPERFWFLSGLIV